MIEKVNRPKINAKVGTQEYLLEEQSIYEKALEDSDWGKVWECLYNATNRYLIYLINKRNIKIKNIYDQLITVISKPINKMQKRPQYRIQSLKYCSYLALKIITPYIKKQEFFEKNNIFYYKDEKELQDFVYLYGRGE